MAFRAGHKGSPQGRKTLWGEEDCLLYTSELAALAQSIDRSGLLNPISVRALPQGGYCLIAGERRWRACQMLGWSRIPALVWQKDDAGAAALTLAENLHRSDQMCIRDSLGHSPKRVLPTFARTKVGPRRVGVPALHPAKSPPRRQAITNLT